MRDALTLLDAVRAYSNDHQLPSHQLFDTHVCKRLREHHRPQSISTIYSLLEEQDEFTAKEKVDLSPYCYKIDSSAASFDDVLDGLDAHYKQIYTQNSVSKGELIDMIIHGGDAKITRSVARVLNVIDSLALWHIREMEARALADARGHTLAENEDKSDAATVMWQHLSSYNNHADRKKLDARIFTGIRWDRFLEGNTVGMIVAVHPLPPSLYVVDSFAAKHPKLSTGRHVLLRWHCL